MDSPSQAGPRVREARSALPEKVKSINITTTWPTQPSGEPRLRTRLVYHSAPAPRALVVARDRRFRQWARVQLRDSGFEILVTNDGFDALRVVESDPPDVIVLDHGLPWFGTIGLLNRLCGDTPRLAIPVLLVVSRATDAFAKACGTLGVAVLVRRRGGPQAVLHVPAFEPRTSGPDSVAVPGNQSNERRL